MQRSTSTEMRRTTPSKPSSGFTPGAPHLIAASSEWRMGMGRWRPSARRPSDGSARSARHWRDHLQVWVIMAILARVP
jgi:hypothetical protein